MKIISIFTHPVVLVISFLLVLISGEHYGGFYLLYILLALPHGGVHALLGIGGIAVILFSYLRYGRRFVHAAEGVLNLIGAFMLVLSLYLFFANDKADYNDGTFKQTVPLVTLYVFGVLVVGFVFYAGSRMVNNSVRRRVVG